MALAEVIPREISEHLLKRRKEINNSYIFKDGDLKFYLLNGTLRIGGRKVHLSSREADLLSILVAEPGQVIEHDYIIQRIWNGIGYYAEKDIVGRIRKRVRGASDRPIIETVERVGYRYIPAGNIIPIR